MKSGSERQAAGRLVVHVDPEISDIVPIFLEHMNQDLKTMQGALHSGDYETIRILGHSMTGAGGGFGFDALTDLGRLLETAEREENCNEVRRLTVELAAFLARVDQVYE